MDIIVLNKYMFNNKMVENGIYPNNVIKKKNLYFITINDYGDRSYFEDIEADNVLKLNFNDYSDNDDIISGKHDSSVFNEDDVTNIIDFLTRIKNDIDDVSQLIIHCRAGQNRSGSVGKFANDFLGLDFDKFMKMNPYIKGNPRVSRMLNKTFYDYF